MTEQKLQRALISLWSRDLVERLLRTVPEAIFYDPQEFLLIHELAAQNTVNVAAGDLDARIILEDLVNVVVCCFGRAGVFDLLCGVTGHGGV